VVSTLLTTHRLRREEIERFRVQEVGRSTRRLAV
jgi:hypothetical protein